MSSVASWLCRSRKLNVCCRREESRGTVGGNSGSIYRRHDARIGTKSRMALLIGLTSPSCKVSLCKLFILIFLTVFLYFLKRLALVCSLFLMFKPVDSFFCVHFFYTAFLISGLIMFPPNLSVIISHILHN